MSPEMAARAETLAMGQNISVQELLRRLLGAFPGAYPGFGEDDITSRRAQTSVRKVKA